MDQIMDFALADWMERIIEESENEAKEEIEWPTLLLQTSTRKTVWSMCSALGVNYRGVPASACSLMEKYLTRHIKTIAGMIGSEEWERYKNRLSERFCLLVVTCIQLAAKMTASVVNIPVKLIRSVLHNQGCDHTKIEIKDAEFQVFRTLGFHIPMWTTLETAEFLAKWVGVTESGTIEAVGLVMDITEFHRNYLELRIQYWTGPNATCSRMGSCKKSIRNVHISAGAVVAALRYMCAHSDEHTSQLAKLTRTTVTYLRAISDAIFIQIMPPTCDGPTILRKRKLT